MYPTIALKIRDFTLNRLHYDHASRKLADYTEVDDLLRHVVYLEEQLEDRVTTEEYDKLEETLADVERLLSWKEDEVTELEQEIFQLQMEVKDLKGAIEVMENETE